VLTEIRKLNGDKQYLFSSSQTRKQELIAKNAVNLIIVRMGWGERIVGHGFRSLFSTIMNENGFNWDAVERQLAHMEQNGVRAAYNRAEYMEERHGMMQWWADYLEKAGLKTNPVLSDCPS